MGALLLAIQAEHQDNKGEKDAEGNHEEHERFIVEIIRCKRRDNLHLVRNLEQWLLRGTVAELAKPVGVVKDDKHVVMDLIF